MKTPAPFKLDITYDGSYRHYCLICGSAQEDAVSETRHRQTEYCRIQGKIIYVLDQVRVLWDNTVQVPPRAPEPIPTLTPIHRDTRSYHIGGSNYSEKKIQPWDIWLEYNLDPWEADIVKRVLRTKEGASRREDFRKIGHIVAEIERQYEEGERNDT